MIEKILRIADEKGLSQQRLERAASLPQGRISKWKDGTGEPTATQAWRMAKLLGVPVDYLLDDEQEEVPTEQSQEDAAVLRFYRAIRAGGDELVEVLIRGLPAMQAAPIAAKQPGPPVTHMIELDSTDPTPPDIVRRVADAEAAREREQAKTPEQTPKHRAKRRSQ